MLQEMISYTLVLLSAVFLIYKFIPKMKQQNASAGRNKKACASGRCKGCG